MGIPSIGQMREVTVEVKNRLQREREEDQKKKYKSMISARIEKAAQRGEWEIITRLKLHHETRLELVSHGYKVIDTTENHKPVILIGWYRY